MLDEVFGEGTQFTIEPPEDAEATEEALDDAVAYDDAGTTGESEFIDEPVDDADTDDEEE